MPTPEEARTLDLGTGVPVLVYARTAYMSKAGEKARPTPTGTLRQCQ
jgi:hypothetical protein